MSRHKHECPVPGCKQQIPLAMWGCKAHWFKLPVGIRNRILAAYNGGEGRLSPEWCAANDAALKWFKDQEAGK